MTLFCWCIPRRPSDTGAFFPDHDPTTRQPTNDELIWKSSNSPFNVSIRQSISRTSSSTAPNSPDTYQDIVPNATSSSSTSNLELYVDDDDDDVSDQTQQVQIKRRELFRYVDQLRHINDSDDLDWKGQDEAVQEDLTSIGSFSSTSITPDNEICDIEVETKPLQILSSTVQTTVKQDIQNESVVESQIDPGEGNLTDIDSYSEKDVNTGFGCVAVTYVQRKEDRKVAKVPSHEFKLRKIYRHEIAPVVDCMGDEFQRAYEVWYRHGLLNWRPNSIPAPLEDSIKEIMSNGTDEELECNHTTQSYSCHELAETQPSPYNILSQQHVETNGERKECVVKIETNFGSTNKRQQKLIRHFVKFNDDNHDNRSRSRSFQTSRVVPILSCFGNVRSSRTSRVVRNLSCFRNKPIHIAFPFQFQQIPPTSTRLPSPTITSYKNYVSAYKEHVAARKAKLK